MNCEHVYKDMGEDVCSSCGEDTHRIDWNRAREQHAQHREKHGYFYNVQGWWSI